LPAKRLLAAAPQRVEKARSSRVQLSIKVESDQLARPITMPGSGEFDYAAKKGRLTMDLSQFLSAAGQSGPGEVDVIVDGSVYYVKYPGVVAQSLGLTRPWVKVGPGSLEKVTGIDVSSLQQANQADPSQTLVYLRAAGKVERVGSEEIDGVQTTKYHAVIDLARVPEQAPADKREAVRDAVEKMREQYGISRLPLDAWFDDKGLPRRMFYAVETQVQGQKVNTSVSIDLSDYGVAVDVAPPPADQVTDISELGS
jgi:hypothetical protein